MTEFDLSDFNEQIPVEMLWADAAGDMGEALRREYQVKAWPRAAKLILCGV